MIIRPVAFSRCCRIPIRFKSFRRVFLAGNFFFNSKSLNFALQGNQLSFVSNFRFSNCFSFRLQHLQLLCSTSLFSVKFWKCPTIKGTAVHEFFKTNSKFEIDLIVIISLKFGWVGGYSIYRSQVNRRSI